MRTLDVYNITNAWLVYHCGSRLSLISIFYSIVMYLYIIEYYILRIHFSQVLASVRFSYLLHIPILLTIYVNWFARLISFLCRTVSCGSHLHVFVSVIMAFILHGKDGSSERLWAWRRTTSQWWIQEGSMISTEPAPWTLNKTAK